MNRLHLFLLAGTLCLIGLGTFFYKAYILSFPLLPDTTSSVWSVEATVSFIGKRGPAKLTLIIPKNDNTTAITDENFISQGFGLTTTEKTLNRRAVWSIRQAVGKQHLFYRANVRKIEVPEPAPVTPPSKELKSKYEGAYLTASQSIVNDLRAHSADTDSLVKTLLSEVNKANPNDNLRLLLGKNPTNQHRMTVAVRLLQLAGIHARTIHGIRLVDQTREAAIEHWLEVFDQDQWVIYGQENDETAPPINYLIWWRGEHELIDLIGADHSRVNISVSRNQEQAIDSAITQGQLNSPSLINYSPFSLPIQTQAVYRIILLIPLGSLLIVVLRNLIGLKTFGTFMPVLVALAFRETQLFSGIIFFVLIVGLGLLVRFYLEHLKLLLVPRLAAIVTVVTVTMVATSIIAHKLGIEHGLSVALFPMVIMTMTIERMSILWEETGAWDALVQAFGTLLAASCAYLLLTNIYIEHLIFVFPELLLVVLASVLLLGRYTGFRLLELYRFRALAEENS